MRWNGPVCTPITRKVTYAEAQLPVEQEAQHTADVNQIMLREKQDMLISITMARQIDYKALLKKHCLFVRLVDLVKTIAITNGNTNSFT